jgi:hypothetical protein
MYLAESGAVHSAESDAMSGAVRSTERADGHADDIAKTSHGSAPILKLLSIALAILTPALFIILDDMLVPMVWINHWTLFVAIAFILHLILLVTYKALRKDKGDKDAGDIDNMAIHEPLGNHSPVGRRSYPQKQ